MSIKKPEELDFSNKKICMIIAGVAGIGKTTLALSSPAPLLIDLDNGVDRVESVYRKDTLIANTFEEVEKDLTNEDLSAYKTIIIDTGGKLLEMLKPIVIKESPANAKRDGTLSLQGYGAIKRKFKEFIKKIKALDKHLIFIFHATEVNLTDDIVGLRIRMEGSSKDEIWDDVDLGGFIEMRGKNRTLGFANCERYYAKGTHGLQGIFEVPTLKNNEPNNFLTKLFQHYLNALEEETKTLKKYKDFMATYTKKINKLTSKEEEEELVKELQGVEDFPLTSKEELFYQLKQQRKKYE